MTNPFNSQRGNVLFLILLAVVLFAALSYAMTSSMRGAGKPPDSDRAKLLSSVILQYGVALSTGIERMVMTNHCTISEISFENSAQTGLYTNASAPSDHSCDVFRPEGGGASWQEPPPDSVMTPSNYIYSLHHKIVDVGMSGAGTSGIDLVMLLPNVTRSVCLLVNEKNGISNPSNDAPADSGYDAATDGVASFTQTIGDDATQLEGVSVGCFKTTATPAAGIYTVFYTIRVDAIH